MTQNERFVLDLAAALHACGIPSHRLENTMMSVCETLSINADFSVTPEMVLVAFHSVNNTHTHMLKLRGSELHLEKMTELDLLIEQIKDHSFDAEKGCAEVKRINQLSERFPTWVNVLSVPVSTASAACLFGGGYAEILVSAIIGTFIGLLIQLLSFFPNLSKLTVLFSAVFAIFISKYAQLFLGSYAVEIATITGLILLIPGFTLSLSITELANGHAQSGTIRFSGALITFIMIAVGIGLGSQLAANIHGSASVFHFNTMPFWVSHIALALVPAGFLVLFKAHTKEYPWMLLACAISFYSMKQLSEYELGDLAVFFSAATLGLTANLISRIVAKPVTILLVPGIILLVPGSIGFKSISFLVNEQTLNGLESAVSTLISAASLTAGLLFSNMVIRLNKGF